MDIKKVLNEATKQIERCSSQLELQNVKVAYLGKKGKITELLKSLKDLSLEEKKSTGAKLNLLRTDIDDLIKKKFNGLKVEVQRLKDKLKSQTHNKSASPLCCNCKTSPCAIFAEVEDKSFNISKSPSSTIISKHLLRR